MAKGILQSPHVLSKGSDAIRGENQTTTHPPDIYRPYSGSFGGEQKKIEHIIEIDTTGASGLTPDFQNAITAALTSLKAVSDADMRSLATAQNNQQYHNARRTQRA